MKEYYTRQNCRLCKSIKLDLVLPLNKTPLCDAYLCKKINQNLYNLDLFLCKQCKLVQIKTIVNPLYIFRNYQKNNYIDNQMPLYPPTSGHSIGLSDHLINYAKDYNHYSLICYYIWCYFFHYCKKCC